jgi:hypothetical protein
MYNRPKPPVDGPWQVEDRSFDKVSIPPTHDFIANPNRTTAGTCTGGIVGSVTIGHHAAERVAQIADQLERLDGQLSESLDLIHNLERKLEPVLVSEPKLNSYEDCPKPPLVPVAESIYDLLQRVIHQNSRLQSIITRLEV